MQSILALTKINYTVVSFYFNQTQAKFQIDATEFLRSMKGERGERGPPGLPGRQGDRGESVRNMF